MPTVSRSGFAKGGGAINGSNDEDDGRDDGGRMADLSSRGGRCGALDMEI